MLIDAMGKECPLPVIMAKKQLDMGNRSLVVKVDNEIAVQNLKKLGESMGILVEAKGENKEYEVYFKGEENSEKEKNADLKNTTETGFFIGKEHIGDGDKEFGMNLMKMAIYTLSEDERAPKYIFFMNGGVKLVSKDEQQVCENIEKMEQKGTKVLVCGACLNYYGMTENLGAGEISNMYAILSAMEECEKVVTL